jgi:hypothetical protein
VTGRRPVPDTLVDRADALAVTGLSWRQIGNLLGVSPARLRAAVVESRRFANTVPGRRPRREP